MSDQLSILYVCIYVYVCYKMFIAQHFSLNYCCTKALAAVYKQGETKRTDQGFWFRLVMPALATLVAS